MIRALLISVRFHDGRYHGSGNWPPSPARLFQALVAAAAQPSLDSAKESLQWLEKLDAPVIAAPSKHEGQHVSLFVPNNDLDAKGGDIRRVPEIRSATKHIRPRLFDAWVPLFYVWHFDESEKSHAESVCKIADGLYQLGRGVDMAWAVGEVLDDADAVEARLTEYQGVIYRPSQSVQGRSGQGTALDCPEEGSLESLENRYKAGGQRFRRIGEGRSVRIEFANAPKPRFRSVAYNSPATRLLFDLRRTTVPGSPFAPWALKNVAVLVQKLRDGAVAKLTKLNRSKPLDEGTINKVLLGRDATEADKTLRLRLVPLPSIGHVHADRSIRRVLVEVPPDCPIRADDVKWVFSGLEVESPPDIDTETGEMLSSPVELVGADDNSMLRYYGLVDEGISSSLWRSVTPLALPQAMRRHIGPARQHEEAKRGTERLKEQQWACHEVAQALRHAGLRHRIASLRVQREPFEAKGGRAEAFADGTRFSRQQLWHAEIEFTEAVGGPIVLGNGRYCGLGLMAPAHRLEGIYSFAINDGMVDDADPLVLAYALRCAVMARVQEKIGKRERLPVFFSGHERDGTPARSGSHAHLAFVPDLERRRLMVIAPHVVEHREPLKDERRNLETLARALTGLDSLRAGRNGKLNLRSEVVDVDVDPLFAASTTWFVQTPYAATRHAKRNGSDSLQSDVLREVRRRGLPVPQVSMSGRLALRFGVAVPGPVLLGKSLHYGGGLFVSGAADIDKENPKG